MITAAATSAPDATSIRALATAVTAIDGIAPLNDAGEFALDTPAAASHWQVTAGSEIVGYAQWHLGDRSALVFVHPDHRRQGIGSALLAAVAAEAGADLAIWAFGDFPPADALAAKFGLVAARGLLQLARPLTDSEATPVPAGVEIRGFTPADIEVVQRINAEAFATHPEQGRLTVADLQQRMAEPWFDPQGLLLAWAGDTPLGFHWTKQATPETGEVYVLAAASAAAGRGVGRALLGAGLAYLAAQGCDRVELYVDKANVRAVELYDRAGFRTVRTDVQYRLPPGGDSE